MKHLLDTSIIVDYLRRKDKENTLLYKLSDTDLHISIITHTELFAGKSVWESSEVRKTITEVFEQITILPLTAEISEIAGRIKAYDIQTSLVDSIIAATTLEHGLTLVTLNLKDFQKVRNLKLYEGAKLS